MTAFATFLSEKIERYIELRRSLGYAFDKQTGTLRAFVHHVVRSQLDGPATRTMAIDFVLSFRGAANSRADVAAADPAAFGIAQRVLAIPTKRAHIELTHHLTNAEVEAIIATPDQTIRRGRRDRVLLLFLARTAPACPKRSAPTRVIFVYSEGPAGVASRQGAPRSCRSHSSGS